MKNPEEFFDWHEARVAAEKRELSDADTRDAVRKGTYMVLPELLNDHINDHVIPNMKKYDGYDYGYLPCSCVLYISKDDGVMGDHKFDLRESIHEQVADFERRIARVMEPTQLMVTNQEPGESDV